MTLAAGTTTVRAFVLAGGLGTRIRPALGALPKALAPIGDRAFIDYLLDDLQAEGFQEVILLTGHGEDQIQAHIQGSRPPQPHVLYSREESPLGTGGAVRLAAQRFPSELYLVMNGDSHVAVRADALVNAHLVASRGGSCIATVAATWIEHIDRFGRLRVDANHRVLAFDEKTAGGGPGLINAGVYVFDQKLIDMIPDGRPVSLERDVFPKAVSQNVHALVVPGPFVDVGVPEDYMRLRAQPGLLATH